MKPISVFLGTALFAAAAPATAQSYRQAAGLRTEFGRGNAWTGASYKYRFTPRSAAEAQLLFSDRTVVPEISYQYMIPGFRGVPNFYAVWGLGVAAPVYGGKTSFLLRPSVGFEYHFPGLPLTIGIDMKPSYRFSGGDKEERFEFRRFSAPVRFVF